MKQRTRNMTAWILVGLLPALLYCTGCGEEFLDFRNHANEAMKQQADLNYRAANQVYADGIPPRSEAAGQMVKASATQLLDTGYPKEPLDISAYFPESVTRAWQNKIQQVEKLKLKEQLAAANMELTNKYLANLIGLFDFQQDKNGTTVSIDANTLLPRLQAIADATTIGAQLSAEIVVPDDVSMTQEEQRRMKKMDDLILALDTAAKGRAAVKPTKVEVAERFVDKATDFIEDNPVLSTALAGVPGGGLVLGMLRGRKKKRQAAEQQKVDKDTSDTLKHDYQRTVQENQFVKDAMNAEKARADALAEVVSQQAKQLAAVVPASTAPEEG